MDGVGFGYSDDFVYVSVTYSVFPEPTLCNQKWRRVSFRIVQFSGGRSSMKESFWERLEQIRVRDSLGFFRFLYEGNDVKGF